jgi:hypothetical protein
VEEKMWIYNGEGKNVSLYQMKRCHVSLQPNVAVDVKAIPFTGV